MVKVLFFAQLSDVAQCQSINLESTKASTVKGLVDDLKGYVPERLVEQLQDQTAMVSINQQYATWNSAFNDGDEIGFLPPVSGG